MLDGTGTGQWGRARVAVGAEPFSPVGVAVGWMR